jgi:cobalt/nickel transport system permease protein
VEWTELLYMGGSESDNPINRVDPRLKIVFVLLGIGLVLLSETVLVPAYFLVVCLGLVVLADVDVHQFMLRLMAPFLVIGVLIVIQAFYYGTTPLYTFSLLGFEPTIYREGLWRGLLIASRVAGGVSLLIALSLTSTVLNLMSALRSFYVPQLWLEIGFLSYRYLFVFLDHVLTSYQAQKTRLGYKTTGGGLRSAGTLAGHLFLHIFDQTSRTHDAMRLRGYRGDLPVPELKGTPTWSAAILAVLLLAPGVVLLWW